MYLLFQDNFVSISHSGEVIFSQSINRNHSKENNCDYFCRFLQKPFSNRQKNLDSVMKYLKYPNFA